MKGFCEKLLGRGFLHYLTQVHDCYPIADRPYYRQVMGDEKITLVVFPLQGFHQLQDSSAYRHV